MSESKYESKITSAPCPAADIYRVLSNLENLERVRDLIPQDKIQEMDISADRDTPSGSLVEQSFSGGTSRWLC